jgi:hypothetical protein
MDTVHIQMALWSWDRPGAREPTRSLPCQIWHVLVNIPGFGGFSSEIDPSAANNPIVVERRAWARTKDDWRTVWPLVR